MSSANRQNPLSVVDLAQSEKQGDAATANQAARPEKTTENVAAFIDYSGCRAAFPGGFGVSVRQTGYDRNGRQIKIDSLSRRQPRLFLSRVPVAGAITSAPSREGPDSPRKKAQNLSLRRLAPKKRFRRASPSLPRSAPMSWTRMSTRWALSALALVSAVSLGGVSARTRRRPVLQLLRSRAKRRPAGPALHQPSAHSAAGRPHLHHLPAADAPRDALPPQAHLQAL